MSKPAQFAGLAAIALLALPMASHAQTVNLLTEEAYPFQYTENKKLTGMAVDIVAEMFKRAGVAHKDEVLPWKTAYERVQIYPNTCLYSTARTENRERLFQWVGPIVNNKWAAFAKSGFKGALARPEDLRNYRVGVLQGDAKERFLKDLAVTFRVAMPDDASIPAKLSLNRSEPDKVDLWITGYYSGSHIAKQNGIKDVVPVWVFKDSENYLACHSSLPKATLDKLNAALAAMNKDGTLDKIVVKYELMVKAR